MFTPEEINTIVSVLSGPASSVGICLLVGWASWKLVVDKILPQHDAQFERMMKEHGEDRDAFKSAIGLLDKRIEVIEDDVTDIKKKLGA